MERKLSEQSMNRILAKQKIILFLANDGKARAATQQAICRNTLINPTYLPKILHEMNMDGVVESFLCRSSDGSTAWRLCKRGYQMNLCSLCPYALVRNHPMCYSCAGGLTWTPRRPK
jgi:hypothetical protein